MTYAASGLTKVGELGLGRSLWCYIGTDSAATVDTSGFITGDSAKMVRVGDLVIRLTLSAIPIVESTTTVTTWGIHVVMTSDGTTIDLSDTLAGVVTNTD